MVEKKKKKKIFYHSDFSLVKSGFGKISLLLLSHLYKTKKYDIVEFCCGVPDGLPSFGMVPWKCIGATSSDLSVRQRSQRDPRHLQLDNYGAFKIDETICEEKPDFYLGVQDIWGIDYAANKKWFSKDNSVIWTTLDSLPILPSAVRTSKMVNNFWVWSDFAANALHKMGIHHVKTVHGPLDPNNFFKLSDERKSFLRSSLKIPLSSFVIGFVFRNQSRKSLPNLLEGYKLFKARNPELNKSGSYLLLHTSFQEGWDIRKLAEEAGIGKKEILATYVCDKCGAYTINEFIGNDLNCSNCLSEKSVATASVKNGVTEKQLNEIYNLMDVYCHPFNSGGQEIPIQEAKLTELITLVTNYSCGEDMCSKDAHSLPLDWIKYREISTGFVKANTSPESICKQLTKVLKMKPQKKADMGAKARDWVIENFSIERIGKIFEDIIDSSPELDKSIYDIKSNKNPNALIDESLNNKEWITSLYKNILDININEDHKEFLYWENELKRGAPRENVSKYFREIANKEKLQKTSIKDALDKYDEGRRILFVIPESAGDVYMATSLFDSCKEQYPDYNLYVATSPQYMDILIGNPNIHKVIPFCPEMENSMLLEGRGKEKGLFEIVFLPHIGVQKATNYIHNGLDKIAFDIRA